MRIKSRAVRIAACVLFVAFLGTAAQSAPLIGTFSSGGSWQDLGFYAPVDLFLFQAPTSSSGLELSTSLDVGEVLVEVPTFNSVSGSSVTLVSVPAVEFNDEIVGIEVPTRPPVGAVPEPGAALLFAAGAVLVALRTGRR